MSFFESEIVQDEILEISKLCSMISENVLLFPTLSDSEKLKRISTLQEMLDKIQLFYVRLSLSEDKEAAEMKERIQECSIVFGDGNIKETFEVLQHLIDDMRKQLDKR